MVRIRENRFITYPMSGVWIFKKSSCFSFRFTNTIFKSWIPNKRLSAFNIQFVNGKPIFIDILSFEKYNDGDYWIDIQFLNIS